MRSEARASTKEQAESRANDWAGRRCSINGREGDNAARPTSSVANRTQQVVLEIIGLFLAIFIMRTTPSSMSLTPPPPP